MAIPQHTIDQILDRIDIVDLISTRVKLKKTGRTYSGCCPFHQEKSPSFHVYRDKAYYHCFGCQANGNAIRFLMDHEQRNFIDVIKDLAQQAGIELPKEDYQGNKATYQKQPKALALSSPPSEPTVLDPDVLIQQPITTNTTLNDYFVESFQSSASKQDVSLYDLLEQVACFYQQQLQHSAIAQNYFQNRALSEQTIQEWRLGYAPSDRQHLEHTFPEDIEGLKLLGLIRENEAGKSFNLLRDRVIFPIRDTKSRIVGFGGRALNDQLKPKYINSPDSEVFHKNQLLYGLYEGRKAKAQDWLMVEGYMDVIALHQAGVNGAVATLGTASNTEHLNTLFKNSSRLTLAFDGDSAGQKAAWRTLEIALPLLSDGRELKFFILPDDHDPDSLIRQIGLEQFQHLFQQAPLLSDFLYAQLSKLYAINTAEGKSMVMAKLKELSSLLPQGTYKYVLSQIFRERLGFSFSRKQTQALAVDHGLNFSGINQINRMASLLLHYPLLYPQFETLRAYAPQQSLARLLLDKLDQIYEHLPEEIEQSRCFALGACLDLLHELQPVLNSNLLDALTINSPEELDRHVSSLLVYLEDYFLSTKKPSTLKEAHNIKQLRYNARMKLNTTEIKTSF